MTAEMGRPENFMNLPSIAHGLDGPREDPLTSTHRDRITTWGDLWGIPDLARRVSVRYSSRLRRSLGRCTPATGAVRLNPGLAEAPPAFLEEVLCHEVAHIAAPLRFGRRIKAHGPEWASLVQAAGFQPSARLAAEHLPERLRRRVAAGVLFHHHCPACGARRTARRAVRRWRCRACVDAGLGGELVITTASSGL